MYSVSSAFKLAMKYYAQEHKITGTVGSVSFDESNIVEGSFQISNQSTDTNDVVLGSCYVGQLTAEFTGLNIAWSKWINKVITPSFGLKVDANTWEYVPLGVFKIKEAKHTATGVQVTAYDNMIKFDKKFNKSHFMNVSGMVNIIDQLCTDAGVICGMSHAQIEALPNGDRTGINIYGSKGKKAEFANDIKTLRDLLFWVAQTLGCFATMNRAGQLEFRKYNQNVVDVLNEYNRFSGATFADYTTHYVGIYVENLDDNTEDYYGYDVTALQEELTETMSEITQDQSDFADLEDDRAEWVQKLANHECTQQEYDAAIAEIDAQEKELTKDINQLTKRAEWLTNAIAQSADDGSDMVLGANPLVMAKNKTTRDEQRREILDALSDISYTPFQASIICGCIYDLGDVIQFSGGLYNSDTDSFGCVMSYTYTHNGGTELEGFGVDPSVVVVRNKTQKSTDRANKNAIDAKEITNGSDNPPEDAKDGDIYVKTKEVRKDAHPIALDEIKYYNYDIWRAGNVAHIDSIDRCVQVREAAWEEDGYHILAEGVTFKGSSLKDGSGSPVLKIPITQGGTYNFHMKIRYVSSFRDHSTNYTLGVDFIGSTDDFFAGVPEGSFVRPNRNEGGVLNLANTSDWQEYTDYFNVPSRWVSQGCFYMFLDKAGATPQSYGADESLTLEIKEFYLTHSSDTHADLYENAIDEIYNYVVDETTDVGKWIKIDVGSLAGLSDTYINNPTDGQILRYDGENDNWTNQNLNAVEDVKVDDVTVVTNNIANINTMTGATSSADGSKGLVPTPAIADREKFLRGDGTWQESSEVEANPTESATENLTKVGIDGTVYAVTDDDAVHSADVGVAGGVAELDSNGKVPSAQLPSYVDDVVEYASRSAFPATGESGKIYVALDTNLAYRWGGTEYVEISPSLALGETSSTAYRGDRGKAAYDHTQLFPIVDGKVCIVFEE